MKPAAEKRKTLPDKSFLILDSDFVKTSGVELCTNPTTCTPPEICSGPYSNSIFTQAWMNLQACILHYMIMYDYCLYIGIREGVNKKNTLSATKIAVFFYGEKDAECSDM